MLRRPRRPGADGRPTPGATRRSTTSDSFRILLDTYRDRQNGFVFATNPAALEYDGQVSNEGGKAAGRAAVAAADASRRDRAAASTSIGTARGRFGRRRPTTGWTAEFEIPFRTLRYRAGRAASGALNFQRTIRRRKEIAYWSPLPIQFDLMRVSMAGSLAGLDLPAQRNLKLIPYALGEARRRSTEASGHGPARRRRPRREIQPDAEPDARRHAQHRLRAGRSRRAAGQPRSVQPVLSGEAAVLSRERRPVRRRQSGRGRSCSSAGASASPRPARRSRSSAARGCPVGRAR